MKIQPYLEKLNNSKEFRKFQKEYPNAFFSAGFFVLDFEDGKNLHQIDYFIPAEKKMATFLLDSKKVEMKKSEPSNSNIPREIKGEIKLDLDILKKIVEDEMKNRIITHKIHKIIAILHAFEGKLRWDLNCITSDMGILKVHIEDSTHSVLKFEKVNLFDAVRKIK